jgi:hypothetical protein
MKCYFASSFLFLLTFIHHHQHGVRAAETTTDNYILVFKHGTPKTDMADHIQLMYSQVNDHASNSTSGTNMTTSDTTLNRLNTQVSSIGNFHWFTGTFPTESFETLFASSQHSSMTSSLSDNVLHYWVKDVEFSVQEMAQKNPPSWVSRQQMRYHSKAHSHLLSITGP